MKPGHEFIKILSTVIIVFFLFQIVSCGTILYPERRGQAHGQIDPAVAILDAAGLLLFIIPGVIAFAVDFATGAIYLPSGKKKASLSNESNGLKVIHVNTDKLTKQHIEEIVRKHINQPVNLTLNNVQVIKLDEPELIEVEVLKYNNITIACNNSFKNL